jgi:hypothetical protein
MDRLSLDDHPQPPLLSDTPFTASTSGLPSPGLASSTASIEDILTSDTSDGPHPFGHAQDIYTEDVRSDPILNKLAKGQGLIPVSPEASVGRNPSFKAKPAPANMRDQAVGPRMSKAAALRMGMEWEDKKPAGERRQVDFANTPGHKRNNLSMVSFCPLTLVRSGPQLTRRISHPCLARLWRLVRTAHHSFVQAG